MQQIQVARSFTSRGQNLLFEERGRGNCPFFLENSRPIVKVLLEKILSHNAPPAILEFATTIIFHLLELLHFHTLGRITSILGYHENTFAFYFVSSLAETVDHVHSITFWVSTKDKVVAPLETFF